MKIYNKLVILFLATPVFSIYFDGKDISFFNNLNVETSYNLMKRVTPDPEYVKAYEKCAEALKDYGSCIQNVDADYLKNIKVNCEIYRTDKCQKFLNEGLIAIPECRDDILKEDREVDMKLIQNVTPGIRFVCTKDENDEFCPYNDIIFDLMYNKTDTKIPEQYEKQLYSVINETCKSQLCIDGFLLLNENTEKYDEIGEEYQKEYEELKKKKGTVEKREFSVENFKHLDRNTIRQHTIAYLKSDKCKLFSANNTILENQKEEKDDEENKASVLHYNGFLIVLISLILSIFI